jgi:hypothetical protein
VLEIPNWAIRLVIMLLALGVPIALIIAWAFELTSEGQYSRRFEKTLYLPVAHSYDKPATPSGETAR